MMKKLLLVLLCLMLAGCAKVISVPVSGGTAFNECEKGSCPIQVSFPADSVFAFEGSKQAKSIYYSGKFFLLGDGFKYLWVGEMDDNEIDFKAVEIASTPAKNVSFDWERSMLKIAWKGTDGADYKLFVNQKGKLVEEK